MTLVHTTAAALGAACIWMPLVMAASVIDFETTPDGGAPADDAALSRINPYVVDGVSVTFGFDTNNDDVADTDAIFERRGVEANNGFYSASGTNSFDSERPGDSNSLGQFFLRQPTAIGSIPGTFIIQYDSDVVALSGEIWDIDAADATADYEQWRLTAYDSSNNIVSAVDSPIGFDQNNSASLDSRAWTFSLQGSGIRRVELEFIGTASLVGLAFNNYDATAIRGFITGDYNADGFVSQADLDIVLLNWGDATVPAEWLATDQFDGTQVSQNELDGVLLNWGNGTPPSLAIPEPASLTILAATLACTRRRRSCLTR